MAVAAAEQISNFPIQEQDEQSEFPLFIVVPEMDIDQLIRQRAGRFIGSVAVNNQVELHIGKNEVSPPIESLRDGIHLAAEGDRRGRKVVETNARTDVIERTLKAGHVMKVDLEVDKYGDIHQHGHTMESVQSNSLIFASNSSQMAERVEAETHNTFRIKELRRQGLLDDYSFVVFSRAADNMSREQMIKAGFFVETMSCAIQVTTAKHGGLTTESAFVAGIKEQGQQQHDEKTIIALGKKLGVDFSGRSAAEIINTPLLIHNSFLSNGVVDLVKMYDEAAGGTFFGEDRPQQDYIEFLSECKRREQTFEPKVQAIVEELIAEAYSIHTQVEATRRLSKISGKHMVELAIEDKSINPLVFGEEAAIHIVQARAHYDQGNYEMAMAATNRAKSTERSSSCPGEASDEAEVDPVTGEVSDQASESWHGGKTYRNSKCRSCKEVKSEVGACHICKDCVHNPAKRKREYDKYLKQSRPEARVIPLEAKSKEKEDQSPHKKVAKTLLAAA